LKFKTGVNSAFDLIFRTIFLTDLYDIKDSDKFFRALILFIKLIV
jgi:hypothetical protein